MKELPRRLHTLRMFAVALSAGEPVPVLQAALRGQVRPMTEKMKRVTLRHYALQHRLRTFVETGTFRGDTVDFMLPVMDSIHSIELSDELHAAAVTRFRGQSKVHLHKGDSGIVLANIIAKLDSPALIWLDAHYSGKMTALGAEETPVLAELKAVFEANSFPHVILIDDVRDFEKKESYPRLQHIRQVAEARGYSYECRFDLIRLLPKAQRA